MSQAVANLVGFTDQRGPYLAHNGAVDDYDPDTNPDGTFYKGAIPVQDVEQRLFNFTVEEERVATWHNGQWVEDDNRRAQTRSDTGERFGYFRPGYKGHQYTPWLLDNVATILDDGLCVGRAGLLKGGAVGFVQVEVPENLTVEGVEIRPFILAVTSFDGSFATGYHRGTSRIGCNNMLKGTILDAKHHKTSIKVRHSKHSLLRALEAREALGVIYNEVDDFTAELHVMLDKQVTDERFEEIVGSFVKVPAVGSVKPAVITRAENRRNAVRAMWYSDPRVAPYRGTAFGAVQAFNTYRQHEAPVRGASRDERNMLNVIKGTAEAEDAQVARLAMAL